MSQFALKQPPTVWSLSMRGPARSLEGICQDKNNLSRFSKSSLIQTHTLAGAGKQQRLRSNVKIQSPLPETL